MIFKSSTGKLELEFKQGHDISTKLWPSSIRLAQYILLWSVAPSAELDGKLRSRDKASPGYKRVALELGCGVHALLSRALCASSSLATSFEHVVATDTRKTINVILDAGVESAQPVEFFPLDWTKPEDVERYDS